MFQIATTVIQSKKNYFSFFSYSYLSVFMYLYAIFVQELAEGVSDPPEVKLWAVGSCLIWVRGTELQSFLWRSSQRY